MALRVPAHAALPAGPHRELVVELHRLYREAGYPGVKKISAETRERDDLLDVVSHEAVSNMLQGQGLPRWSKLECVVRVLAAWSVERPLPDDETRRFQRMWHAASGGADLASEVRAVPPVDSSPIEPVSPGLVVEHETAHLSYVDGWCHCTVRRALFNGLDESVVRYPVKLRVDRYPDNPERSARYHRDHPLSLDELSFVAECDGEPMEWRPFVDADALKEIWLHFENAESLFSLYPGHRTEITYSWHVPADKWGDWFQRTIRLPTRQLSIEISFPASMRPEVWGVRTSLWHDNVTLPTPISQELTEDGRAVFSWHTEVAALHDRYRLEWRFRRPNDPPRTD